MEFVYADCVDQIHKLGEDFTQSLGNMTLIIPQDWLSLLGWVRRDEGRQGEEGEDSDRGEDRDGRTETYR